MNADKIAVGAVSVLRPWVSLFVAALAAASWGFELTGIGEAEIGRRLVVFPLSWHVAKGQDVQV